MNGEGTDLKKLEAVIMILSIVSLTATALECIVQFEVKAEKQEIILFEDDFESYSVGSFPSKGGWELVFNGEGTQYQVIVDKYSVSQNKSLQLLGAKNYNWAAHAQIPLNSESSVVGFEVNIMVETNGGKDGQPSGRIGFSKIASPSIANYSPYVSFRDDSVICTCPTLNESSYVPGNWYKVRMVYYREINVFSVWINDRLLISNITGFGDPYSFDNFALSGTMEGNSKIYFDDVKVFAFYDVNPKLELEPETGIAVTTLVGSGFAPNSEVAVTWNDTKIHAIPYPLLSDEQGKFTAIISVLNQTVPGFYNVTVSDEYGNTATAKFEVISLVQPDTGSEAQTAPNQNVSPEGYETAPIETIPEFPSWAPLLIMLFTVTVVAIYRSNLHKRSQRRRNQ